MSQSKKKKWFYHSENVGGNVHSVVELINNYHVKMYPGFEVVSIISSGTVSILVWREPKKEESQNG